jgi:ABC-type glycerol-3-phosphate transport system permease component
VEKTITITRDLRFYPQYGNHKKSLAITLNLPYMNRLLAETEMFESFYVVDDQDRILFSTQSEFNSNQYETFGGDMNFISPGFSSMINNTGVVLTIIPLVVLYIVCQKSFVEGIERSGIVG